MQTTTTRVSFGAIFCLYLLVVSWVWLGSILTSGGQTAPWAILQVGTAVALGTSIWILIPRRAVGWRSTKSLRPSVALAMFIGLSLAFLIILHWILLGGPPVLRAALSGSDIGAGLVRDMIPAISFPLANYIPTLVIKAGVPFLVMYFAVSGRQSLAAFCLAIGLIYAISLMQKSYPLYVVAPPAVFFMLRRSWKWAAVSVALGAASVVLLVLISNPSMFSGGGSAAAAEPRLQTVTYTDARDVEAPASDEVATELIKLITWRVLVDPGLTVNQWFGVFPRVFPFTHGCSYRFLAPLLGCAPVEASEVIWRYYYPDLKEKGYNGSSGAAHFMEEYAAFGTAGLPLASFLAVLVLLIAAFISSQSGFALLLAMNFPFVFALSSTGLHTTILSGGWGFALMLVAMLPMSEMS